MQALKVLVSLVLLTVVPVWAQAQQQERQWTWRDQEGQTRTREDLDAILSAHVRRSDPSSVRANLTEADLTAVDLTESNLTRANLFGASLTGAIFEPASNPLSAGMAAADGLEFVTYRTNSGPLSEMRKQFRDLGFREAERKLTFALRRKAAADLLAGCRNGDGVGRANACGFYLLNRVGFDLPSQYGMTPGRPLLIAAALWVVFSMFYALFIHVPGPSGLYVVVSPIWGKERAHRWQIVPRAVPPRPRWLYPFKWLRREWRVVRAAMMLSLMSAFNIGFREINFGRWIRLLMKREYDIRPIGWVRTVSGVQSLITVYLVGLWVLTYFGRPFE